MRHVVINETVEPAVAFAFTDFIDALARYKELLLKHVKTDLDFEPGDEEYDQIERATSLDELGSWPSDGPIFMENEGDTGVWTGFVSSDRCGICGPLPLPDDDFIGNGDPNFYLTVGHPDGEEVQVTASCSKEDTHPIYAAWLAKYGDEAENDEE